MYTFLRQWFLFPLDKYSEVELLSHMVVLVWILKGTFILFSTVAAPIYVPINNGEGFPSLHLFLFGWFSLVFWKISLLTLVRWSLSVVLIHISLMIRNVEYLSCNSCPFVYLLWKKCLFRSIFFNQISWLYWTVWVIVYLAY